MVSDDIPPDAVYLDSSQPTSARVADLLSRMTLGEKAGQMFQNMIVLGPLDSTNPYIPFPSAATYINTHLMTHFNIIGAIDSARAVAQWHNELQKLAQSTRLGIPVSLSTDPRNHFSDNPGVAFNAGVLSQWPETLGFAALRDEKLVERFADVARQEYLALGIRVALHPQVDLATEPRWSRIAQAFGEDAALTGRLAGAYIRGFQTEKFGKDSISCMVKHFPGGGPQKDSEDPHFEYGKEQVYPGNNFDYHLEPFVEAIRAGVRQVMPYYGQPVGEEVKKRGWEEVGFALNKPVITGELKEKLGFSGIVCTDWGIISDAVIMGQSMPARAWGCEHLSPLQRVVRCIDAGCDQFGGEFRPELVIQAVEEGLVSEKRLDESVAKLLNEKFEQGLFDDRRFVDSEVADALVGREDWVQEGELAQRRSFTLLTNKNDLLPLRSATGIKLFLRGVDEKVFQNAGFEIAEGLEDAKMAVLRLRAPYEPRPQGFEAFFHAGSLKFPPAEIQEHAKIFAAVPTVVDIYLDRPAVIPEIVEGAAALLCNYGASGQALVDVLTGIVEPEGRLPFDLPPSMEAIAASKSDMQYDTDGPLFRYGDGRTYTSPKQ